MRIIHCADLHLDSPMHTNLDKYKAKERKQELLGTYQRMVDYAVKENISAILIAGDLFDKKNITKTAQNVFIHSITDNPNIDFYYLKGNHDNDVIFNAFADKEIPDNLHLFRDSWTTFPVKGSTRIKVSGLELNAFNVSSVYDSLFLNENDINIVMLHGQTAQYQNKKDAQNISLKSLAYKYIDYLALGHIHTRTIGQIDKRGTYCYPGCLEGRGFDECGDCGFVILDIDEESGKVGLSLANISKRKHFEINADISGTVNSFEIQDRIDTELKNSKATANDLIKIVLTGETDINCEKNIDTILSRYKNSYYYVKLKDRSKIHINIEDYELDKSLKGEFIRLVNSLDMSAEDKSAIIKCGLDALTGEEF